MASSVLFLVLLAVLELACAQIAGVPACANPCMETAYTISGCDLSSSLFAECICMSQPYIQQSTCCIRASCAESDRETVGLEAEAYCSQVGIALTPLPANSCTSTYQVAVATGNAVTVTANPVTTPSTPSNSTPQPTGSSSGDGGGGSGLSSGAWGGIGAIVGILSLVVTVLLWWLNRRRERKKEEEKRRMNIP